MNPDNTVDIIESFHVMDQEKMGEITAQQCYTLVLGLGMDVPRTDLNALILQYNDQNLNHITLHVVLKLLKQFERDQRAELDKCFQLIVGGGSSNDNNKITPHALVKLSEDVGEPVSLEQAQAMMQNWNGEWSKADLERILSSPSISGTYESLGNI